MNIKKLIALRWTSPHSSILNPQSFKKLLCIALLLLLQNTSYATLNLELTKGVDRALPIALVPFQTSNDQQKIVNAIIAQDLTHSGEFNLLDPDKMNQTPHNITTIKWHDWQQAKINNLIIGKMTQQNHIHHISFNVLDVYKDPAHANLSSKSYTSKPNQLRTTAHHIADDIYEKLLGERGIFSTKIAYILEKRQDKKHIRYSLMVADADGYNPKPILISDNEPIMSPSWSPDGQHIAYVSFEKRRAAIYVSNIITGKRELITHAPGINGAPKFSPDGKKLAAALSRGTTPKICIIDLKTHHIKQITKGWSIDTEPAWAPDGQSIIFTSGRAGHPQIYRIDLSSMKTERLTYVGNYNASATLMSDGKTLVMMHRDDNHNYRIATLDLSTDDLTVLTNGNDDQSPSLSPNGKMILYATHDNNNQQVLGLVSINGTIQLLLPETEGEIREPAWSV